MKKITFILLALITGTAFAQNDSSADAQVFAEIVSPITIVKTADLNFGKIAVGTVSGSVTVKADNTYTATYTDSDMQIPSNTVAPARFAVNAPVGTSYGITIPDATLTSSTGTPMPISFIHNKETSGNVGKGVPSQLIVGGVLNVNASQEAGEYQGTAQVTVSYE